MGIVGNDSKKMNMLITLVIWCILCGGSMAGMLVVASDKTIVITDAAPEQSGLTAENNQTDPLQGAILKLVWDDTMENQLCIPLESGTKAEQVIVENRYMNRELWIYIKKAGEEFYRQNAVSGDVTSVKSCQYEVQEDGILLKLQMDTVWEYHNTMEGGSLKIAFSNPRDSYRQIVVVDSAGNGKNGVTTEPDAEKELALQIAKLVQKKVEQPEIKIYITGNEDGAISKEQILQLVQAVKPDLFVQIGTSESSEDTAQYGICAYYNDEYYIPKFGNVEWSDMVTKEVTVAVSNRALGLFPAEADSILKELDMPATAVSVGYMTNAQERALLLQESYQEKLAGGIAEAIQVVYTNTYVEK